FGPGTHLQSGNAGPGGSVNGVAPDGMGVKDKGWNLIVELDGLSSVNPAGFFGCRVSIGAPQTVTGAPNRQYGNMIGAAGRGDKEGDGGDTTITFFGNVGFVRLLDGAHGGASVSPGENGGRGGDI